MLAGWPAVTNTNKLKTCCTYTCYKHAVTCNMLLTCCKHPVHMLYIEHVVNMHVHVVTLTEPCQTHCIATLEPSLVCRILTTFSLRHSIISCRQGQRVQVKGQTARGQRGHANSHFLLVACSAGGSLAELCARCYV